MRTTTTAKTKQKKASLSRGKLEKKPEKVEKAGKYTEGIGRRKTAVARVRIAEGKGTYVVNGRELQKYFPLAHLRACALEPFSRLRIENNYDVSVKVQGGGINAQAEAVRHGLSRALVALTPDFRARLHALGFLTRDPRMVERKKYGLKKARRAPQWQKR